MAKTDLFIRSSYLVTKEKSPIKSLKTGRFLNEKTPDNLVFYLIEVETPHEDASKTIKTIVDSIEKKSKECEMFDQSCLEQILESINNSLESNAKGGDRKWIGLLNAIIGVIENDTVHIASTGKISGYLIRKGRLSSLTEGTNLSPIPQKTFVDITSGPLTENDKVVFGNNLLYDFLSLDRVRRFVEMQNVSLAAKEINQNLKHKKVALVNAVFLEARVGNEDETLTEIYYLDEKEEGFLQKVMKKSAPIAKKIAEDSKTLIIKTYDRTAEISKSAAQNAGQLKEKYQPKSKEFFRKSAPLVSESYKNTLAKIKKNSPSPDSPKIKTKLYNKDYGSKAKDILALVSEYFVKFFRWTVRKENRKIVYIFAIILFLFLGYLKVRTNNLAQDKKSESQRLGEMYSQAENKYDKAKENIALGRTTDTVDLEDALSMAKQAATLPENKEKSDKLIKSIQKTIDDLNKTTRFYDPAVMISLGGTIQKSVLVGLDIYSVNNEGKVYSTNTASKEKTLVASIGRDNGDVLDVAYSDNDNKIYILTSKQKVLSFDITSKTNQTVSMNGSKDWEYGASLASFSSSLYLLDNDSGVIFKHTEGDTEYSKASTYIDSRKVDLKNAYNLQIDGNVYVLLSNGQIAKISKGVLDTTFQLKNIPDPNKEIKNPVKIITGVDVSHLFLLDKSANRIIKFDKSGNFINQYAFEGMTVDDFMINTKIQKGWVVAGDKLYQFDL